MFKSRKNQVEDIFNSFDGMEPSGYQLTIVYDLSSVGGEGVKSVTKHFDTEEAAQKEADKYRIGDWHKIEGDGRRTIIHDVMVTATYVKSTE